MAKFVYSPDVDILVVQFSDRRIDYAEEKGPFILHYSRNGELVSVEIQDAREFVLNSLKAMIGKTEPQLLSATE